MYKMFVNSDKLNILYDELDNIKLRDLLYEWGYESKNDNFPCLEKDEKNPSMVINEEQNIWHCFSCNGGGKVGHMITHYYATKQDIKDPMRALDMFLKGKPELRSKLGFSTIRQASYEVSTKTPQEIIEVAERCMSKNINIEEVELKRGISKSERSPELILSRIQRIQNGGITYGFHK